MKADISIKGPLKNQFLSDSAGPSKNSSEKKTPFADLLKSSIEHVDDMQQNADQAIQDFVEGNVKDVHQTLLAVNKADISFRTMLEIRNKVIRAYEEIMRMPI